MVTRLELKNSIKGVVKQQAPSKEMQRRSPLRTARGDRGPRGAAPPWSVRCAAAQNRTQEHAAAPDAFTFSAALGLAMQCGDAVRYARAIGDNLSGKCAASIYMSRKAMNKLAHASLHQPCQMPVNIQNTKV